jgi:hypothetical protein
MSNSSPNLSLPFLMPSQAQKHVTHNEALLALDALVQLSLVSRGQSEPPSAPEDGSRYLVAADAQFGWSGQDGRIACFRDGAWNFHLPRTGWIAWVADEARTLVFDGSDWRDVATLLDRLGINSSADATNRLAVGGPASLFDGLSGSHQIKINKAAPTDTGAVLFQTGYSGRAEFGLTGSDTFELKVSADGSDWTTALAVDGATGRIGIGKTPGSVPLEVGGGIRSVSSSAAYIQLTNSGPAGSQAWIGVPDWNRSGFYIYGATSDIMAMYDAPSRSQRLYAGGIERVRISSSGDVGIGTATPSTRLHVDGPVRVGSYAKAALPAASSAGAGAIAYVSDATGGAQLTCSDGTQWLKVRDGLAV